MLASDTSILVTGAGGVIGQAVHAALIHRGFSNVTFITSKDGDLRNEQTAREITNRARPEIVFHLAARVSGIMGNIKNPVSAFDDNIRINTNVIAAAQAAGARKIVAMGTAAVYSDLCKLPIEETDFWLGPPHSSEAPYGHAKRAMLAQLEAYQQQFGLDYAYCVSTNLYGPHDRFDEEHGHVIPSLISKFYRAQQTNGTVVLWGDGTPQRDFLFSADAANALCLIAEKGQGVINLASGTAVQIRDAALTLAEIAGYKKEIVMDRSKPNGQIYREYSIGKLKSLQFCPDYSLRRGLEETYAWYAANDKFARR